jgi:hypothetical protein
MPVSDQYEHPDLPQPLPRALYAHLPGLCRRRTPALLLPIALAALILLADLLLPSAADYAAFLLVPLLLAAYCGGWKFGVAFGWVLAGAAQLVHLYQPGGAIPAPTAATNFVIWGMVASLLAVLAASVLETQALREANIRLRTLQQTMVTVNDIVRNRLAVLLALCDVLEEGRTPSPRQVNRGRAVIEEIVHQLDRLGRLEVVKVREIAGGVEAVDLDAKP